MIDFNTCSADETALLYAIAIHQLPINLPELQQLMRLQTNHANQRRLTEGLLAEILDSLHKRGWLIQQNDPQARGTRAGGGGLLNMIMQIPGLQDMLEANRDVKYQLSAQAQQVVLLEMFERDLLSSWINSLRAMLKQNRVYHDWAMHSADFYQREMLHNAFLKEAGAFAMSRERLYRGFGPTRNLPLHDWLDNPHGQRLFANLEPWFQQFFLLDLLHNQQTNLEDCAPAYRQGLRLLQVIEQDFALLNYLGWYAINSQDWENLRVIEEKAKVCKEYGFVACSHVMRGEYETALQIFEAVHKSVKQVYGKRKIALPGISGMLYCVALLNQPNPANLKRLKEQIEESEKDGVDLPYSELRPLLQSLQTGERDSLNHLPLKIPALISTLFAVLAGYWRGCEPKQDAREVLQSMRQLAKEHGYHWVAAELDWLLHRQYGEAQTMPDWHAQHHFKPLGESMLRVEDWQRALTALAKLKTASVGSENSSETRLAWSIQLVRDMVKLAPLEQKRGKLGWSKGRAVALKRLRDEQDSLPYLNEYDKRAAECIQVQTGYYGATDYSLDGERTLPSLIGHPALFWSDAPDVRLDLAKAEFALHLQQNKHGINMQLLPPPGYAERILVKKQTPTKLQVFIITPEIRQISSILGNGVTVPVAGKEQLMEAIGAIAPHLAIHSDLPELAANIASMPADSKLYAHLLPLQEGLRLQFLVRPLPQGGWYTPGKGSASLLGEHEGRTVQVQRDLAQEKIRLKKVQASCASLHEAEEVAGEWQLEHPAACLELLSELQSQPAEEVEVVWPEGERFRIRGKRSLSQMRLGIKQQGEWFVASGDITLDDGRVLALRELMQLTEGQSGRFLKLGDNDYLALSENFSKRLAELRAFGELSGKDGVRVSALAAPALADLAKEVGELQADAKWRAHIQKLDALADFQPQVPSTLQAELRDYQQQGFTWLARLAAWGVGACLADDMGLGKTVQALALLVSRAAGGPALVVAPISVAMNWESECARFAPTLRVRAYHQQRSLQDLGPLDIVIASYTMLQQDVEQFTAQHWHSVVLDEAQAIKNSATKRSQAAMELKADFKMIATGTPMENHLGELWNLFRFINPGLLGSKERFAERFALPIERGEKAARLHLKKLIQPFILRRTKTQVLSELPSRTEITLQVPLSDEERHLYEALRQQALEKIAGLDGKENKALHVLAEITKLRRFCCNPQLVLKNSKVAASKLAVFGEVMLELLENRHKALVFSQFVDHLQIVRAWLDENKISYQYLDGSTPPLERKQRVDAFQAGEGSVFLISLKAGGTGLNLTAADYVIHLDPWWNPAVEDQASDRAHRMGQKRPVTIYRLVTEATIEEKIIAMHAEKRDLADSLLEGGDSSGKLDTAALLGLLQQSA